MRVIKPGPLCNKCGKEPKYPSQGLCRKCYFDKMSKKYIASQKERAKLYPIIINLEGEIWVELEEEPGYALSNMGRVKCLNYRNQYRECLFALSESRKGSYFKFDLKRKDDRRMYLVHRLVAKYFVPNPCPEEYDSVLHKDENKQNNRWDNLKWGTLSQNRLDYIAHIGKHNLRRKTLTDEQVLDIYNSSETIQAIALKHNTNASTVWMIKSGRRRSSVTGAINNDERAKIKNENI